MIMPEEPEDGKCLWEDCVKLSRADDWIRRMEEWSRLRNPGVDIRKLNRKCLIKDGKLFIGWYDA